MSRSTYLVSSSRNEIYSCFEKHISICEIGVQTGANAFEMNARLKPRQMYLIDPWKVYSWDWLQKENNFTDELLVKYKQALLGWHPEADLDDPDKS